MFTNSKHEAAHKALKKGEIDKSILLYTEALIAAPNDCNILSDRATAFLHKKDKLRSMADFDKAVALDPNYSYRYASRAFAKQNFGDLNGAVADYEKAVKLDPDDAVAHNNLGMLLEQQGYKKAADDRFARADKLSKMEDELYAVIDDLEDDEVDGSKNDPKDTVETRKTSTDEESLKAQFDERTANAAEKANQSTDTSNTTENTAPKDAQTSKEFKKVFTSRQQFREFLRFIKNGFKLK